MRWTYGSSLGSLLFKFLTDEFSIDPDIWYSWLSSYLQKLFLDFFSTVAQKVQVNSFEVNVLVFEKRFDSLWVFAVALGEDGDKVGLG